MEMIMTARRNLRKYFMLLVKLFVSCFPLGIKKWFRQSPYLTSLYSRNLQKSGLFYGFPSRKKLEVLYQANIKTQDKLLASLANQTQSKHNALVIVHKASSKTLTKTLESLISTKQLSEVWILCGQDDFEKCETVCKSINSEMSNMTVGVSMDAFDTRQKSALLLFAGDIVHPRLFDIIDSSVTNDIDCFYCDTDNLQNQKRESPQFFPDWNPDLHLSTAYIQTALWLRDVDFLKESTYTPNPEFIANALVNLWVQKGESLNVHHSPFVLVHKSIARPFSFKRFALQLNTLLGSTITIDCHDEDKKLSLAWPIASAPLVSLVIPTKNGQALVKACIDSILQKTTYEHYEILLVDNNSDDPEAIEYFKELNKHPKIRLLDYPYEFNYSAINNFAVSHAKGSVIGLVNNDIEVISPNWLSLMLGQVLRPEVGCVGAKLLYSDGRIQHAGVVLGYGGGAGHAHKYFPQYHPGYLNRLGATGNYSAVTAACLLVTKEDYLAVNGLNETDFKVAFNDVDFCLKVLELGRRNVFCAEAELFHHESISRGFDDTSEKKTRFDGELAALKSSWSAYIKHDPAYNTNLTLKRENFSIKELSEIGRNH
jgi:GT2 family glycosyltransferase